MRSSTPSDVSSRVNSTSVVGSSELSDVVFDPERMPTERQPPLRLHRDDLPGVRLTGVGLLGFGHILVDRRRCDGPDHRCARHERSVEAHSEPLAELLGIADRPPDSIQRCLQQNFLLDPI